ncbi:MAG: hypothetical protein NVS9B15_24740 [Acidobacteriaceae bacterium]
MRVVTANGTFEDAHFVALVATDDDRSAAAAETFAVSAANAAAYAP